MADLDVRDLEGRFGRLVASITIGLIAAVLIGAMLPGRIGVGGPSAFAVPVLFAAGAIVVAILVHAGLHAAAHRRPREPRVRLPKARARRISSAPVRPHVGPDKR